MVDQRQTSAIETCSRPSCGRGILIQAVTGITVVCVGVKVWAAIAAAPARTDDGQRGMQPSRAEPSGYIRSSRLDDDEVVRNDGVQLSTWPASRDLSGRASDAMMTKD